MVQRWVARLIRDPALWRKAQMANLYFDHGAAKILHKYSLPSATCHALRLFIRLTLLKRECNIIVHCISHHVRGIASASKL
jgi:hypothetical protein